MKTITYITGYFLFMIGVILLVSGVFTAFGIAHLTSGIFSSSSEGGILSGAVTLFSIISGGKILVGGLLLMGAGEILFIINKRFG